jgi:Carboxypeptidase regulatory-like domain
MVLISRCVAAALAVVGLASAGLAGIETVEIRKVQVVRGVSGMVSDPSGAPIAGAVVSELGVDGKTVVRTVQTDKNGHFSFPPRPHHRIYSLRISINAFNPLIVPVKISQWSRKTLKLYLEVST